MLNNGVSGLPAIVNSMTLHKKSDAELTDPSDNADNVASNNLHTSTEKQPEPFVKAAEDVPVEYMENPLFITDGVPFECAQREAEEQPDPLDSPDDLIEGLYRLRVYSKPLTQLTSDDPVKSDQPLVYLYKNRRTSVEASHTSSDPETLSDPFVVSRIRSTTG